MEDRTTTLSQQISYSLQKFTWDTISIFLPRHRPLEVIYGRIRYCHSLFDDEMTLDNCARNWTHLFHVFDANSLMCMCSMFGSMETVQFIVNVHKMEEAGSQLIERKDESLSKDELAEIVRVSWQGMQREIRHFMETEEEHIRPGAIKHCKSLQAKKYLYEAKGFFKYPFYSL